MKVLPVVSLLLALSAAADDDASPSRISALQQTFRYTPLLPPIETTLVPESDPVVVLAPLIVTGKAAEPAFREEMEIQPLRLTEQVLFWKGKAIASKNVGQVRAEVGAWFSFGEKTLGVRPSRDIYIKVELLRFGW